ncbi:cytochrome c biogenesis protein ResB [Paeniglutamicibacter psychrophenolicus]|uniref:Cytochrome c biogenesis protein n=1 Tax=Paeniglutamicibacter psychrophenolicus TaxID=257454 RepID=A0ABS4WC73_9MICC|nr:cytochrome c biogenesis protein ResB [Paeniglutamicibacter psychrophenolicus]MBP2373804.1 cytochrome c biogenesis protein [Paeniglutamicibacter psychrophenolicus]
MKKDVAVPALGFVGMLRWAWTQLTSMKTALFLLLLLAVAAVPGSLFPQRSVNPEQVTIYLTNKPTAGEWLDRFQLFDVYSSVWFSAIYMLLFVSLIGCILPRVKKHAKALRTPPPRTPSRLNRLPQNGTIEIQSASDSGLSDAEIARQAAALLKKRGYRSEARIEGSTPSVGAERGYIREIGNLLFHISLVGLLASVGIGGAFGYNGQRVLVEGETFVNSLVSYDSFKPGTFFKEDSLDPYSVKLDKFNITFDRESTTHFGQPIDFTAEVETRRSPDAEPQKETIRVNHPLRIDGADMYLVGNGYAPVVTVRDGAGNVAFSGPVVSVPQDGMYTSLMVIKAPDAKPDQLGFQGFLLPTAMTDETGFAISGDPNAINPQLQLNSYYGNLGLDDGNPQNVYVLETDALKELNNRNLDTGGIVLSAGQTYKLPDGKGSISFDGLKRFIGVDIAYDPSKRPVAIFAALSLLGLGISLFTARRRAWVKVKTSVDGSGREERIIEYGLLARGEDHGLESEAKELRKLLEQQWPAVERAGV